MRIIKIDEKSKELQLKIEDDDDLWVLHNIIDEGDELYAKTTREIKIGDEGVRKSMYIGIKVEKIEFQPFTNRLRVGGPIIYHPEKYEEYGFMGAYHTIGIKAQDEVRIIKNKLLKSTLKYLERACKLKSEKILIVSIDDEEVAAGVMREYGIEIIFEIQMKLPGKKEAEIREEKVKEVMNEIITKIYEIIEGRKIKTIIISGISYLRERLTKEILNNKEKLKNIILISEDTSSGGVKGINEILKKDSMTKALKTLKIIEDSKIMREYLEILSKNTRKVTWGISETYKVAKIGAIKTLIISNRLLRSCGEVGSKIEEIIEYVEKYGGEIRIISEMSEAGRELISLGGIVAILRYEVNSK
ncbi:MAG: mRNA surveillance protein pelota [Candidatus Methanomethylicia archaeon]|nr:mRNA surveillance protein pelota [Candidatus Methanomethylicia archaeon]MCX8169018.1 mRNA surveillance protein pelota [Candidatus Methanomethylicia archaeon]MDW7988750.1 mRNA surveillance protein pelota [Nitrososphaerota archaeon]